MTPLQIRLIPIIFGCLLTPLVACGNDDESSCAGQEECIPPPAPVPDPHDDFDAELADAHQSVVALCHYISECVDLDGCLAAVNQWIALTEQRPHCLDELQEVAACFDAGREECYGSQLITSCDLAESQFRGCLDS